MTNIKLLKDKLGAETSESIFDIYKQPKQQCPIIDNIQSEISRGIKEIEYYCKELNKIDEAYGLSSDINSSLSYFYEKGDELEKLREEIIEIRRWGQCWKDLAKSVLNDIKKEDDIVKHLSYNYQIKYSEIENYVLK